MDNLIVLRKFIRRLLFRTGSSVVNVVGAVVYLARLRERWCHVQMGKDGFEFRLFSVALMLAHKLMEDSCPFTKLWCEVCGISLDQMVVMEVEFLFGIDFRLLLTPRELAMSIKSLATMIASHSLISSTDARSCLEVLVEALVPLEEVE
ncbi:hypothetical protein HDU76_008252 [Blyttiomyces sp. JEL0837]|nr:hypothetical protein HDU76_008252 [Blyttiomyces sp. JEL0837]